MRWSGVRSRVGMGMAWRVGQGIVLWHGVAWRGMEGVEWYAWGGAASVHVFAGQ